ncbi:MAG TPA: ABC transporter substrate-binding protein [Gemmatimonadales bacterium]|nr:ABC transporter substrate-binding protein [Gemmatimonadales bacterium]
MALSERVRLFAPRLGALLLAASLLTSCDRRAGDVVRIGVAGSFSDPIGLPMRQAAELAAEEINATGGVNGKRLELVLRDDYSDPDSAVFVAGDLYHSDVSAVVGHLFSGMTLAAAPVYNGGDDPVAAISPSSSSPEVSDAGDYTFRICPSDLAHGTALAHWVRDRLHFNRGVVLYLNDEYGRGIRQTFVAEYLRLGGVLQAVYPYLGERPDVAAYLDRMAKGEPPEFIVVAGNRGEAEEVIRQARRRGLTTPVLGGDGLEGIQEAGALAEGVYLSSPYFPSIPSTMNRRFVQAFRRKYPSAGMPNQPAAGAYDAVYLLRDVIAKVGSSRASVRRALAGVGSVTPPFDGVTGTVAFDGKGDVPNQNVYIGLVRHGAVEVMNGVDAPVGTE